MRQGAIVLAFDIATWLARANNSAIVVLRELFAAIRGHASFRCSGATGARCVTRQPHKYLKIGKARVVAAPSWRQMVVQMV